MNQYKITLSRDGDPSRVESLTVKCNNVPCAIQKAVVLMTQRTGVSGWKYVSHRLVSKAWERDYLTQAMIAREYARTGRIPAGSMT